jgi:transposase-like protein
MEERQTRRQFTRESRLTSQDEEIGQLKRELAQVREERDILRSGTMPCERWRIQALFSLRPRLPSCATTLEWR